MKGCFLILRAFCRIPEHLARRGEIEPALGSLPLDGGKDVVSSIEVGIDGRKLVFKGIGHEALSRQVVALIGLHIRDDVEDRGIAFHGSAVNLDSIQQMSNAPHPRLGVLDGHPPYDPMNLITLLDQKF